uniref:Uncharacterized protein n=1 Tax=Romanomermis culicivorax TaxID=13658 RepID=A0A915HR26_ROMCU
MASQRIGKSWGRLMASHMADDFWEGLLVSSSSSKTGKPGPTNPSTSRIIVAARQNIAPHAKNSTKYFNNKLMENFSITTLPLIDKSNKTTMDNKRIKCILNCKL